MSSTVGREGFFDISPTCPSYRAKGHDKENDALVPVLSLVQFSRSPFVTFGTVKLDSSKSLPLCIENPTEEAAITVTVDKIPSSRGFSVDQTIFTIPPEDKVIISVTWTPAEEGGVRELLSFIANGIVKHQAVLLGKAEGQKPKKQKSLWDTIKSKRVPSHGGKVASTPIKAANKTFRVSRQPQYKRNRASNPLKSLNQENNCQRPVGSKEKNSQSVYPVIPQGIPKAIHDELESMPSQNKSPVVLLVPADKFLSSMDKENISSVPLNKPDYKECRVLNKTMSPIGTPERFNALMPRFQSPLPYICKPIKDGCSESLRPILSVDDALAVINSDLSCPVSPPNACSSLNVADSVDSVDLSLDGNIETTINVVADSSPQIDIAQPRLTFFVKSTKASEDETIPAACPSSDTQFNNGVGQDELNQDDLKPKKILLNSATVIKSKAGASPKHSPDTHKTRTIRRQLLRKSESNTDLLDGVSVLPVVNSDSCANLKSNITPPQESELKLTPQQPSSTEPANPTCTAVQPILTFNSENNANSAASSLGFASDVQILPLCVAEDMFPVHSRTTSQNRKRKSEEYLRNSSGCLPKTFEVKQSSDEMQQCKKSCREQEFGSRSKQSQRKITASSSRKSTKVSIQKSDAKSTQRGGHSLKSFSSSNVKTKKVIAVAQNRLNFIKPTQTAIPRHPMPFAAKNMFYDERWIEKQERGFTWWLNYVLTPDDFKVATEVTKVNALSLTMGSEKVNIPKAPTKEEMSFRTYTARRHLNRVRRAACQLFTSEKMAKAIKRLEVEVEAKRLLIRKDRHLWKDIGERQKVLNWLLSYNPLWLRIGLETIFGELISLESNSDIMGMAMFILGRLLWNPDIAAEFRHPKVPHLYRDGHEEMLSRFTLKKLLLLVCFLDKAKESRLIEHDPCLFCMDAEFKTSKDLLLAFSRDFLSGEGILPRHLGLLGLAVSHVQTPLDEFNFAVQNLATDLKCGIRLVRVMEIFTQDWSLSCKLRMPAISRLQKVHNVGVVLQVLKEKGVDLKDEHGIAIDSRDIVDGHREKTLNLLWKIIFSFQVEILLDVEQLKEEISFLRKTWRTKQKLLSLGDNEYVIKSIAGRSTLEHSSEKLALLMDWVNAVCGFYGLKAENFTVSFSDGRILCYLIHHYHPNHLRAEDIQQETTQTIECGLHSKVELNNSSSDSDYSFDSLERKDLASPIVNFKMLLENERRNFQLVSLAVSYLGAVPAMITPEDMSNTIPNEKVVTCYLSFLCTRLLDLRNETRAARVIQSAWRSYKLQKDIKINQLRNQAAKKIQDFVRCFIQKKRLKRQNMAATVIQAIWRGHMTREELRRTREAKILALQESAAILIQKTYKEWKARVFLTKSHAAVVIQTAFRIWHTRKMAVRNSAAIRIQAWYRMQQCQKQYLRKKSKVVLIQAWFRGTHQRREFQHLKKRHQSAVVIQSAFRGSRVRKRIGEMRRAAVSIQMWYKACLIRKAEQKRFEEVKSAAVRLQAAFRGWRTRREMSQQNQAALVIQTAYRRCLARRSFLSLKKSVGILQRRYRAKTLGEQLRREYLSLKCATIKMQALWRGQAERKRINLLHLNATVIQSHYRKHVVQTKFMALKQAAIVIQNQYKCFRVTKEKRSEFLAVKKAAIVLQSAYRGMRVRRDVDKKNKAAAVIQSAVRAYVVRKNFLAQRSAAIILQQHYRAYLLGRMERLDYVRLKKSTISLQAICRGCRVRREQKKRHHAATLIQAYFRKYKAQVCYVAVKCAATIIQQHYRAYVLGKEIRASYLQLKTETVIIQSIFRGMKVRRNLRNMRRAATVIQAHVRGHRQLVEYRRQKWAAAVIQRQFRAHKQRNIIKKQYLAMKEAAVCIQAAYRGMRVRKWISEMHIAAIAIQRKYKAHKQSKEYQALKQATILVQRRHRANLLAKRQRELYCAMQKAAISLQAAYRGVRVRKWISDMHMAAKVIQRKYRTHKQSKEYQALKQATILVQRRHRANLLAKRQREWYCAMQKAAIALQAAFRGMRVRREICMRNKAAKVIQAHIRGHLQLVQYRRQKWAASVIQRQFHANKRGNIVQKRYIMMKEAAVCIQAAYRGMRVRKWILQMQMAAKVIQRKYKAYKQSKEYQALRQATILVQRRHRANLLAKRQREWFCVMQKTAISLQAAYRGVRVRKWILQMQMAAKVIQRKYRTHKRSKEYQALKQATILVQRRYRANLLAKRQREWFCAMRKAAIAFQAAYRGMRVRKEICKRQRAATVVQAWYRMYRVRVSFQAIQIAAILIQRKYQVYKERKRFLSMKAAVLLCQRKYRAILASRQQRKAYRDKYNAVLAIQAGYRGMKVRQQMQIKRKAAITIQSHVRKRLNQKYYQKLLWASRTVQRLFRANKLRKQAIESFRKKRAAIILQAAFRGMQARQALTQKHQACTILQSAYRAHCARTRYLCMKYAAIAIQQRFRSALAARRQREQFLRLRRAVITIQAYYRGLSVRREMILRHQAATIIQAAFRRHGEETKYQAMRLSSILIQRHYRSYVESKAVREKYLALKTCAIRLQAAYRGHSVRQNMAKMHNAATVIQAAVKMHKQRSTFRRQKWAAEVIQERFRAWKLGNQQRQKYLHLKDATLCLQKWFRGKKGRELVKRIKAARTIQSYVRMSIQRRCFMKTKAAAVTIQYAYRAHYCRMQQSRMQNAAVLIQQWYRSCRLVQKERKYFQRIQKSTLTLQHALRQAIARRFEKQRLAAIKIQSVLRMHLHRRRYVKLRSSAVKLQANFRMRTARRSYLKQQAAAVIIQTYFRAYRAKLEQRHRYLRTLDCIRAIQAGVRGLIASRRFQEMRRSAVKIQACYRGMIERRKFQQRKKSACVIQKHYRAYQLCQTEREQFLKLRNSALLIQREFRAYRSRRLDLQRRAALKIQAWFRGCQARRAYVSKQNAIAIIRRCLQTRFQRLRFQAIQHSVSVIQQRWRETLIARKQRAQFLRIRNSVVVMQTLWRGARKRRAVQRAKDIARRHRFAAAAHHHLCAVRIQRALRIHWAMKAAKRQISSVIYIQRWYLAKLQQRRYLEQRQKIITVQRAVKAWFSHRNEAATVLQRTAKTFLLRRRKERLQCGIIKFQALWRGHRSRKLHDTAKMVSIRHRLQKVNREAKEEDKLCHKTSTALTYLLGYQNYAHILTALKHLETATRLSPESCEHLVNSGATHTIFTLIRNCNRSVPSMEVITLAIQVLLHLSKYNKTIDAVYDVEDSVETLLDLLQMYREKAGDKVAEKGGSIFTKACFLLVILVQDEKRALEVKKLPRASDRICRIYKLILKKCKMDAQRTKVSQRMNVSLNGSFLPQATPQKSKPILRFVPDWVLERKKMNIVDPLSAIQALVKSLAIVP
ncbi:LOW QUALITY PROTEIN: abnormal spindle-like microcephaly-associated protein [Silurus meridionalis]|uniref:LOW QUALITY PROTEIN: abnormal spindle-like microcephaly-associated protein n=1 Tax=Silurus meridionalis TaxID=175797 RepID=UPI001EEC2221|nr:LOW QUALITY PROTEIN: abnormal spindle-like microcephaly-associated protein [Silurus meridionalis]